MYKLTSYARTRSPLPGVPWRDLTDEEYAAACVRHPGMEEQGYFYQEQPAPASSRRTSPPKNAEEAHGNEPTPAGADLTAEEETDDR